MVKFQKSICNDCHDLLMISPDINNNAVITVKGVDYGVSKSDAIRLLENSTLGFIENLFHKSYF